MRTDVAMLAVGGSFMTKTSFMDVSVKIQLSPYLVILHPLKAKQISDSLTAAASPASANNSAGPSKDRKNGKNLKLPKQTK